MSVYGFEQCLCRCIEKNEQIVTELTKLKDEMIAYHYTCNGVKTAGTAVSATGTGILLASVAAIPLTGGLSMLGGASGLAMTVGGSAANFITDWFDSSKTKATIKGVQDLVDGKKELNNQLDQHFDKIRDLELKLTDYDISREDSLLAIFTGIANGSVDKVDADSGSPGLRLFTTLARMHRADQLILKSYDFGVKNLELIEVIAPFAEKAFKAMGITTRVSAHTARTLGRISAGFSLIMTFFDIALLVKDWSSNHPTVEVIDNVIQKVNEENENLKEIHSLIDSLKERVYYTNVDELPIVGATDRFNELVVHLLNGQSVKCTELLKAYELSHSLSHLETNEHIISFITDETKAVSGFDKTKARSLIAKQNKNIGPTVNAMVKDLIESISIENMSDAIRSQSVINTNILDLYRDIIDSFTRQTYDCSFDRLTQIPTESVIFKDYYSPISDEIKHTIEEAMIAKIPTEFLYINSNAVFHSVLTCILRESAKQQMMALFCGRDGDFSAKVTATVYMLNHSRVYVDECALYYWLLQGGSRQTFDECRAAIQSMLQDLNSKLTIWVALVKQFYPNRLYPVL